MAPSFDAPVPAIPAGAVDAVVADEDGAMLGAAVAGAFIAPQHANRVA